MKVRIQGNSIRFRLGQSEVERFHQLGEINEVTAFGKGIDNQLSFILKENSDNIYKAAFESNTVTIEVPAIVCTAWTETGLVGFKKTIEAGEGATIKILVEKDFKCIDGSDAENDDAYPNPKANC